MHEVDTLCRVVVSTCWLTHIIFPYISWHDFPCHMTTKKYADFPSMVIFQLLLRKFWTLGGKLCQEWHEHARSSGGEAHDAQVHPSQLCKAIMSAIKLQRRRGDSGGLGRRQWRRLWSGHCPGGQTGRNCKLHGDEGVHKGPDITVRCQNRTQANRSTVERHQQGRSVQRQCSQQTGGKGMRAIISMAASGTTPKTLMTVDVSRAYVYAKCRSEMYVELCPEAYEEDGDEMCCWRLEKAMYGTRSAAQDWQHEIKRRMLSIGYLQGKSKPCLFYNISSEVVCLVHGDDFLAAGEESALKHSWQETGR